jgi:hypothetical protein
VAAVRIPLQTILIVFFFLGDLGDELCLCLYLYIKGRVSTEVTFWHSAEYGSDFWRNSGEIPLNSAEFRGISPELRKNHFRSQKIPRNSVSAEFRGHPNYRQKSIILKKIYKNSQKFEMLSHSIEPTLPVLLSYHSTLVLAVLIQSEYI